MTPRQTQNDVQPGERSTSSPAPAASASPASSVSAGSTLLSVRDLRVVFTQPRTGQASTVVDGLSMHVPAGGSVAIVGESGSGKTVSMRALLGILPETAHVTGHAVFDGQDLVGLSETKLRAVRGARIGMVFQNAMSALNPTRTLKVQLTEHLCWHGISNRKQALNFAIEALERVGIPEPHRRIRMYPFQLSGGQRQRAMIAMAIAARPQLLIADEPTTALDVTVQRQVLDLLRDLRREDGLALVMITHDLGVARYLCDDIVVMRHGHLVETAPMRSYIAGPQHAYSQQLLNAALDTTTADTHPTPEAKPDSSPVTSADDIRTGTTTGAGSDARESTAGVASNPEHGPKGPPDLVSVHELGKVFHGRGGDIPAVTDMHLTITRGETVGIVGESGSGKSTLARLLTRLVDPTTGSVAFEGTDVLTLAGMPLKAWRRRVQMVFQNPYASLLPHQTIAANVAEPLRVHKVGTTSSRRARAIELLDLVGIPKERVDQYPRQFSGGQQQRVAIARALALEPDLLVCDEPTSALDVSIQAQVLNLLQDLKARLGLSMLFITHNLAVAQQLCDRIVVMAKGHVIETAPTHELFTHPQHPYTQALLAAVLPVHSDPIFTEDTTADASFVVDTVGELVETSPRHWVRATPPGAVAASSAAATTGACSA